MHFALLPCNDARAFSVFVRDVIVPPSHVIIRNCDLYYPHCIRNIHMSKKSNDMCEKTFATESIDLFAIELQTLVFFVSVPTHVRPPGKIVNC